MPEPDAFGTVFAYPLAEDCQPQGAQPPHPLTQWSARVPIRLERMTGPRADNLGQGHTAGQKPGRMRSTAATIPPPRNDPR